MNRHRLTFSRRARTWLLAFGMVLGGVASVGGATSAAAATPTGDYAVFAQCPRENPEVNLCLYARTESGGVTIGEQTVPISNPIVLQGGIVRNEETEAETIVPALNGETLTKSPQPVPGGLAGLLKCDEIGEAGERAVCELLFENGATGVTATTELAEPASDIGISKNNLVNREGIALSMPVKIHLENPLLGGECYIGSDTQPIVWNLTSGTTNPPPPNAPINGKVGSIGEKDENEFVQITNNTIVDNSFAVPEASGCGEALASVIDPILDSKLGLPSAAGNNTAILNNTLDLAAAESVRASEE